MCCDCGVQNVSFGSRIDLCIASALIKIIRTYWKIGNPCPHQKLTRRRSFTIPSSSFTPLLCSLVALPKFRVLQLYYSPKNPKKYFPSVLVHLQVVVRRKPISEKLGFVVFTNAHPNTCSILFLFLSCVCSCVQPCSTE